MSDKQQALYSQRPSHRTQLPKMMTTVASNAATSTMLKEAATAATLSVVGTASIIAVHHRYRRQHNPDAKLSDYLAGLRSELVKLRRAHHAAVRAFYQSYHSTSECPSQPAIIVDEKISSKDFAPTYSTTTDRRTIASLCSENTFNTVQNPVRWVSGVAALVEGGFGVAGIDAARQIVWQTPMPERVHDIVVQPWHKTVSSERLREVVVMGRRPSEHFWVLDTSTGTVRYAINAQPERHFYGHACYSLDGRYLYVTENDTVSLVGKIGVYDSQQAYHKIDEFDSFGIGPHELVMHPDGETLIIANGGIKTEKASREELNVDTMRPSLVYLNRHNGKLLEQVLPEHNQMSVRHLDIHHDGRVMIGVQFQGPKHVNVPLVLTHQRGDAHFIPLKMPNDQWQCFHQYIASVAVDSVHDLLCVTSPIGGCAVIYDLSSYEQIETIALPDCAGTAVLSHTARSLSSSCNRLAFNFTTDKEKNQAKADRVGFIVSDGQGSLTELNAQPQEASNRSSASSRQTEWQVVAESVYHKMSFDNHLQVL